MLASVQTTDQGPCVLVPATSTMSNWFSWQNASGKRVSAYYQSVEDAMGWYRIVK